VGYTHYWRVDRDADRARLVEAGREMAKVLRASAVPLADGMGEPGTEPVIDLDAGSVWFNGVEDDGCETFYWPPDLGRPAQNEQIEVTSDGTLEDFLDHTEHGEPGEESPRSLYVRVFGNEPPIPGWFTRDR
jgi:hypothetical protein